MLLSKIKETNNFIKPIMSKMSSFNDFDIESLIPAIRNHNGNNSTADNKTKPYRHPLLGDNAIEELQLSDPISIRGGEYIQSNMPKAPVFKPNSNVSFSDKATSFLSKIFNEAKSQTLRSQIKVPLSVDTDVPLPELAGYADVDKGNNSNGSMPPAPQFNGKTSNPSRIKWRQGATDWINKQAGTTIGTEDRIMIGRRLFGDDYRGTLKQNEGIINEIKSYTNYGGNNYTMSNLFGK